MIKSTSVLFCSALPTSAPNECTTKEEAITKGPEERGSLVLVPNQPSTTTLCETDKLFLFFSFPFLPSLHPQETH